MKLVLHLKLHFIFFFTNSNKTKLVIYCGIVKFEFPFYINKAALNKAALFLF